MKTYPHPAPAAETAESRELCLYIANDEPYYRALCDVQATVARHVARGEFDADLAVKAFRHLTNAAARNYVAEYGSFGDRTGDVFRPEDRHAAATELAVDFVDVLNSGPDYWLDLGERAEAILEPLKEEA